MRACTFPAEPGGTGCEEHDPLSAHISKTQESVMKALITAFALLSFVAASTVPFVAAQAQTQTQTTQQHPKKKVAKHHKKKAVKKVAHKKAKHAKKKAPAA
jgi:hypothetical protein